MKTCDICGREFEKSQKGRLRIAKRKKKGEDIAWICKDCAKKLSFRGEKD